MAAFDPVITFELQLDPNQPEPQTYQGINDLFSMMRKLKEENDRLKRGDFTPEELQELCHNMNPCSRLSFVMGCDSYQKKLFGDETKEEMRKRFIYLCSTLNANDLELLRVTIENYRVAPTCRSYAEKARNPLPPNHESPTHSITHDSTDCYEADSEDYPGRYKESNHEEPTLPVKEQPEPPLSFWYLDSYDDYDDYDAVQRR